MDKCAWCRSEVPKRFRRNLKLQKAKPDAKTFYHYACAGWKKLRLK